MWTKTAVHLDATPERPEGWHYAQVWSNGGGPIGYCAEHPPHATEEQARLCYSRWLLDNLKPIQLKDWTGCEADGCDMPTKDGMETGYMRTVMLCDEHRQSNLHAVALLGLDKPAGDSVGS